MAELDSSLNSTDTVEDDFEEFAAYCSPLYPDLKKLRLSSETVNRTRYGEELAPADIRWFFKDKKKSTSQQWHPFIGYDSLQLEFQYRALKRQGQCEDVAVRGGLYTVSIEKREYTPIYWNEEPCEVMRGSWFNCKTWQPIPEDKAKLLEEKHLELIPKLKSIDHVNQKAKSWGSVSLGSFYVEWYSLENVFAFSEKKVSKLTRSVGVDLFGINKSSTASFEIQRGYCSPATDEEKIGAVTHLVFVVHGIAQRTVREVKLEFVQLQKVQNMCTSLRNLVQKFEKDFFPDIQQSHRVEFIPIEWRSNLTLDGGVLDSVTLKRLRSLRELANASLLDILYYSSPLYRQEIIHEVMSQITRLYSKFTTLNPSFEPNGGRVSLIGHSLGSVICYDILTNYDPVDLYIEKINSDLNPKNMVRNRTAFDVNVKGHIEEYRNIKLKLLELEKDLVELSRETAWGTTLPFKVENYYAFGSPLGCFLALRGVRPTLDGNLEKLLSKDKVSRFYNLYHAADPVAYRLEPIVLHHYQNIHPLKVYKWNTKKKILYDQMALSYCQIDKNGDIEEEPEFIDRDFIDSSKKPSMIGGIVRGFKSEADKFGKAVEDEFSKGKGKIQEYYNRDGIIPEYLESSSSTSAVLEHRLDYVLREKSLIEGGTGALAVATAHLGYWTSKDTAMFLLDTMLSSRY